MKVRAYGELKTARFYLQLARFAVTQTNLRHIALADSIPGLLDRTGSDPHSPFVQQASKISKLIRRSYNGATELQHDLQDEKLQIYTVLLECNEKWMGAGNS